MSIPVQRNLTGNWGSPGASYAAFALSETNGNITGYGWISSGGVAVTLNGTRNGEQVALKATLLTRTAPPLDFYGEFSDGALVGDMNSVGRLSLTPVDTVATALAAVTYSRDFAPTNDDADYVLAEGQLTIRFNRIRRPIVIVGPATALRPGTYNIGLPSAQGFSAQFTPGANYQSTSGQLTITAVGKRALFGTFTTRVENGSNFYDLSGSFSASCAHAYLNSAFGSCSQ